MALPGVNFVPTLVDGDSIADAHVGPDGDIWVVWWQQAVVPSFRVSIFNPDMTHQVTHDLSASLPVSSYTQGRYAIVVNKNNVAVIAYQEGSIAGGVGTWVRTLTKAGTLGTARNISPNFTDHPQLTLWHGCEDAIYASPATTAYPSFTFRPFATATETLGTAFTSPDLSNSGIYHPFLYSKNTMVYDPWTDEIHIFFSCSTDPTTNYPFSPFSIGHVWGTSGQNVGYYTPPGQFQATTGSYFPIQTKVSWTKKEDPAQKTFVLSWRRYTGAPTTGQYSPSIGNPWGIALGGWNSDLGWLGLTTVFSQPYWDDGTIWDSDVYVDGGGNVHIIYSGTDCPTFKLSNRPGYECLYGGTGVGYWNTGTGVLATLIQAVPCCTDRGDNVQTITMLWAKGYPHLSSVYAFVRISYWSAGAAFAEDRWSYSILDAEPSFVPEGEVATCGAEIIPPEVAQEVEHTLFVFDTRT